jgi:Asp-tRNA(Asn)/Glu-tRNA(Gln) amidotransferase B subunit
MYEKGGDPTNIMDDLGLQQMDNDAELESVVKEVLAKNEKQVAEYKAGKPPSPNT